MSADLDAARIILCEKSATCVFKKDNDEIVLFDRGIKPLFDLIDSGKSLAKYSVADKVVGKAAALLYCKIGIMEIYAGVISRTARKTLGRAGISVEYGELTDRIINRSGTGFCPMESAVIDIDDISEAETVLRRRMADRP